MPWSSSADQGSSFVGQLLGGGFGDRLRLGGEFEYRRYEIELFDLEGVGVQSYDVRAVLQAVPFPDGISPYGGIGIGLQIVDLSDDRIDDALRGAGVDVDTVGFAAGGIGFLGLQGPLGDHVSLFIEGRASLAFDADENLDALDASDLGAVTGMAGIRVRF